MLDAFIIEQLKRQEREENNRVEQHNRLELPLRYEEPRSEQASEKPRERDEEKDRGVMILDLSSPTRNTCG